jgi:hypothetical protein
MQKKVKKYSRFADPTTRAGVAGVRAKETKRVSKEEAVARLPDIAQHWLELKNAEMAAKAERHRLERIMRKTLGIDTDDRTFGEVKGAYEATGLIVSRTPRKIHRPLFEILCGKLGLDFKKLTTQPREREVAHKEWDKLTDAQKIALGTALDFTNCAFIFSARSLLDS